ncbi:ester cyclase [Listeria booriae]|uniref:ester cyclase n=1 Tax=Listeria booriae TaxID=1552123 RepID=UPI0021C8C6DF|nr:ester cyclase [Listeria booriae]
MMISQLTLEEKRAIPKKFHTNLNNRDFDKQYELITDNIKFYKNGQLIQGADNFVNALRSITASFEDAQVADHEIYADGNVAVSRYVMSGSLTGDITFLDGTSASKTQKAFTYNSVEFFEFTEDGLVYEIRQVNDSGLTPLSIEAQVK